jgi:sugar phosphate isomerase/epimerase
MSRLGYAASLGVDGYAGAIDFARKYGLRSVELSGNIPDFFPENMPAAERASARAYAEESRVALSIHAPEDINLMSPHESLRVAGVSRIIEFIGLCRDLGATRLTVHPGTSVHFTMPSGRVYLHDVYPDEHRSALTKSLLTLRDVAGEVFICVENVDEPGWTAAQPVLETLLQLGGLYLTWDIGHSFDNPEQQEFMRRHLSLVRDVHLHDHDGRSSHKVLGTGIMDVAGYLRLLKESDVYFHLETRPADSVAQSMEALSRYIL